MEGEVSEKFDINAWERAHSKYFLRTNRGQWQEVTEQQFVDAERRAGFFPKSGCGPVATAGFSISGPDGETEGRIEYTKEIATQ